MERNGTREDRSYILSDFYKGRMLEDEQNPTVLGFAVKFLPNSSNSAYTGCLLSQIDSIPPEDFDSEDNIPKSYRNTAIDYLYRHAGKKGTQHHDDCVKRARYLHEFLKLLYTVVDDYSYMFTSIDGLGDLYKIDPESASYTPDGGVEITIKTREGLGLIFRKLALLYRLALWDDTYRRWCVPENMREFTVAVTIKDLREFNENPRGYRSIAPHIELTLEHCEFKFIQNPQPLFGSISNEEGTELEEGEIKFTTKRFTVDEHLSSSLRTLDVLEYANDSNDKLKSRSILNTEVGNSEIYSITDLEGVRDIKKDRSSNAPIADEIAKADEDNAKDQMKRRLALIGSGLFSALSVGAPGALDAILSENTDLGSVDLLESVPRETPRTRGGDPVVPKKIADDVEMEIEGERPSTEDKLNLVEDEKDKELGDVDLSGSEPEAVLAPVELKGDDNVAGISDVDLTETEIATNIEDMPLEGQEPSHTIEDVDLESVDNPKDVEDVDLTAVVNDMPMEDIDLSQQDKADISEDVDLSHPDTVAPPTNVDLNELDPAKQVTDVNLNEVETAKTVTDIKLDDIDSPKMITNVSLDEYETQKPITNVDLDDKDHKSAIGDVDLSSNDLEKSLANISLEEKEKAQALSNVVLEAEFKQGQITNVKFNDVDDVDTKLSNVDLGINEAKKLEKMYLLEDEEDDYTLNQEDLFGSNPGSLNQPVMPIRHPDPDIDIKNFM